MPGNGSNAGEVGTIETIEGKPCYVRHFDSLADQASCKPSACNMDILTEALTEGHFRGEQWFGVKGGAKGVADIVAHGWPDGVERMEKNLSATVPVVITGIKRRRVRGDSGDIIDMQRVYRGELDTAWERTQRNAGAGGKSTVSMYVDIGANSNIKAGQLFWRGAAALSVADALTAGGYSVEIVAGMYDMAPEVSPRTGINFWHTVTVKQAAQPLDKNALAAVLCCSGYMRTVVFTGICAVPGRVDAGLGVCQPRNASDLNADITGAEKVRDQASAQAWIDATLARYINPQQLAA